MGDGGDARQDGAEGKKKIEVAMGGKRGQKRNWGWSERFWMNYGKTPVV